MTDQVEVKHADLQHATKDINEVFGLKQSHITKRQALIDFIVNTVNGCIGPDPDNAEQSIWTDERAGNLKSETINTYTALVEQNLATEVAEDDPASAVEAQSPEVAAADVAGEPDPALPKECPNFGKDRDPTDEACQICKRTEECAQVIEAKAAKKSKPKAERKPSEGKDQFGSSPKAATGQMNALFLQGTTLKAASESTGRSLGYVTGHFKNLKKMGVKFEESVDGTVKVIE